MVALLRDEYRPNENYCQPILGLPFSKENCCREFGRLNGSVLVECHSRRSRVLACEHNFWPLGASNVAFTIAKLHLPTLAEPYYVLSQWPMQKS